MLYYNGTKRINAGMLTAMMNRVGDGFILLRIAFIMIEGGYNFNLSIVHKSSLTGCLLILLFIARATKRAQVPFSA